MAAPNPDQPIDLAYPQWRIAYEEGPYTSLRIIEILGTSLELEWQHIITQPHLLRDFDPTSVDFTAGEFRETWEGRYGSYTSFVVKVATLVQNAYDNVFDFEYYDIGGHRVARCNRTAVVIDAVSDVGPFEVPNGVGWRTPGGVRGRWRLSQGPELGTHVFERDNQGVIHEPMRPIDAIATCVHEVACSAVLVCKFRLFQPGQNGLWFPRCTSCLRWRLEERYTYLELTPNVGDRHRRLQFKFGDPAGNRHTHLECATNLQLFIQRYGIRHQWEGDVERITRQLWRAAVMERGPPTFRTIGM